MLFKMCLMLFLVPVLCHVFLKHRTQHIVQLS